MKINVQYSHRAIKIRYELLKDSLKAFLSSYYKLKCLVGHDKKKEEKVNPIYMHNSKLETEGWFHMSVGGMGHKRDENWVT